LGLNGVPRSRGGKRERCKKRSTKSKQKGKDGSTKKSSQRISQKKADVGETENKGGKNNKSCVQSSPNSKTKEKAADQGGRR